MKGYVGSTSRDSRAAAVLEEPQSRGRWGGALKNPSKQTDGVHAKPRMLHTHTPYIPNLFISDRTNAWTSALWEGRKRMGKAVVAETDKGAGEARV